MLVNRLNMSRIIATSHPGLADRPTICVVLTLWESTIAAEGLRSLPLRFLSAARKALRAKNHRAAQAELSEINGRRAFATVGSHQAEAARDSRF